MLIWLSGVCEALVCNHPIDDEGKQIRRKSINQKRATDESISSSSRSQQQPRQQLPSPSHPHQQQNQTKNKSNDAHKQDDEVVEQHCIVYNVLIPDCTYVK